MTEFERIALLEKKISHSGYDSALLTLKAD